MASENLLPPRHFWYAGPEQPYLNYNQPNETPKNVLLFISTSKLLNPNPAQSNRIQLCHIPVGACWIEQLTPCVHS